MTTYARFDVRIFHVVDSPLELQRKLEKFITTLQPEPDCPAQANSVEIVEDTEAQVDSPESVRGIDEHARCTCDVPPCCPRHGWLAPSDQPRLDDWQKEFDLRAVLARIVAARDSISPQFPVPADLDTAINVAKGALGNRCDAKRWGEYNPLRCARTKGHSGEHAYVVDGEYDVDSSLNGS